MSQTDGVVGGEEEDEDDEGGMPGEKVRERGGAMDTGATEKPRGTGGALRQGAHNPPLSNEPWSGPCVRFDLPRGNAIEIRLRSKVTPEEFKKIKQIFDLSGLAFLEDEDNPDRPPDEAGE